MKNKLLKMTAGGVFALGLATAGIVQGAPPAGLPLARDNQAVAIIIVEKAPDATNEVKQYNEKLLEPAKDLQKYLTQMSGVELALIAEGDPLPAEAKTFLYVGHTKAAAQAHIAIPSGFDKSITEKAFEEEGYIIKSVGRAIYLAGNQDGPYRGTAYAVYAFLEKLGCRWFFPGAWGEVVPKLTALDLPTLDIVSRPDFAVRNIWYSGWVPPTAVERKEFVTWLIRNGMNPSSPLYPMPGDGSLSMILPPAEFAETHPDYYAMDKTGVRRVTPKSKIHSTMLCLSSPEVLEAAIQNIRKMNERKGSDQGIGISPPDGAPFCYCPACAKANQNFYYPTYVFNKMMSEEYFDFACKIADAFPNQFLGFAAYSNREVPPQGVKFRKNMSLFVAPISCDILHPNNDPRSWRRQEFIKILTQFRRQTPHVWIYDYNPGFLLGMFLPERDAENMAVNAPIYKQLGIKGMNREGRKAFMQSWISYYVTAKLLWNSSADLNALKTDFYGTFFGAAGPEVRAWWDTCAQRLGDTDFQAHEDWLVNHIYTADFVKGLRPHVEAARAAVTEEPYRGRVEAFALIADHLEAYTALHSAAAELDFPGAQKAAEKMEACKSRLQDIYSAFGRSNLLVKTAFTSAGSVNLYEELTTLTDGRKGSLAAALPRQSKFARDPFNEGVIGEWYAPTFEDSQWDSRDTFLLWEQQEKPLDARGHDYDGYGWYRMQADIPKTFTGKPLRLWLGGAVNEVWVWVNGEYVGHREHKIWWMSPHTVDLDISKFAKPGAQNQITVRIWNDAEFGGLYRRAFIYSPNATATP